MSLNASAGTLSSLIDFFLDYAKKKQLLTKFVYLARVKLVKFRIAVHHLKKGADWSFQGHFLYEPSAFLSEARFFCVSKAKI